MRPGRITALESLKKKKNSFRNKTKQKNVDKFNIFPQSCRKGEGERT